MNTKNRGRERNREKKLSDFDSPKEYLQKKTQGGCKSRPGIGGGGNQRALGHKALAGKGDTNSIKKKKKRVRKDFGAKSLCVGGRK